ncbi:hypothetical protein A2U01_0116022, partial [Trifolium medium]|nr:hypothetical protein [Trifolium medium]
MHKSSFEQNSANTVTNGAEVEVDLTLLRPADLNRPGA